MQRDKEDLRVPQQPVGSARGWRIARRVLLVFAFLATLLAVFHTVENWRGKRAWEKARRHLEAKGEELDWNVYMPKPVPEAQNFFAAPKMREWFVKKSMLSGLERQTNADIPFSSYALSTAKVKPVHSPDRDTIRLAVFHVQPARGLPSSAGSNIVLRLSDPEAPIKFYRLLQERLSGMGVSAVRGLFVAEWPDHRPPIQIDLLAEEQPGVEQMRLQFLPDQARLSAGLRLDVDGTSAFKVHLGNLDVYLAADYLEWTDAEVGNLAVIQKALERPLTRIEGDYTRPFESPIPNYIRIRTVAQMLADRAECHLLLNDPQAALEELTLLHRFAQRMNAAPRFLVSTMIHVAVTGLYTSVIQDGLRLHAWQEPQLLALEQQLRETEPILALAEALRTERAASCRTFEMSTAAELAELMNGNRPHTLLQKAGQIVQSVVIPRGWIAQNRAVMARYGLQVLETFDLENQTVAPEEVDHLANTMQAEFARFHPYTFYARIAVHTSRAVQAGARNQAMVQAAMTACALERYHLNHGTYPEALSGLVPRYLAEVPKDPIGGEPLKYRLSASGYLLYSIGWNQMDNGGIIAPTSATAVLPRDSASNTGDWVWR